MSVALKALKPDPIAGQKEKAIKHHLPKEKALRDRVKAPRRAGKCLTKGVELEGERAIDEFIKESNMDRSLIVAARDIYERHSLEGITELPIEELEALVL